MPCALLKIKTPLTPLYFAIAEVHYLHCDHPFHLDHAGASETLLLLSETLILHTALLL